MGVAWPSGVPDQHEASGTSGGPQDPVASFQPDVGPSIDRPRTTVAPEVWRVRLVPMTLAQFDLFRAWVKTDLALGTRAFDWVHPTSRAPQEFRFVRANPLYSATPVQGHLMNVSFQVIEVPS